MTAWGWGGGNDKTFTMPSAVNNGAWHHVVKTYNGTTLDALHRRCRADRAGRHPRHGHGHVRVRHRGGDPALATATPGGFFNGSIDEVSFYTSVLNQATVTDHYQLGGAPSVDPTGPTGGSVDATGLVGTGSRYSHLDDP